MDTYKKLIGLLTPSLHMWISTGISALTGFLAFRSAELAPRTLTTFFAFYFILVLMTLLFSYRSRLTNPKTRQLLQFSYLLMGFVLMLTGVMGIFNGNLTMILVFLLMLFLPGLALMRAGLHMNRNGDNS